MSESTRVVPAAPAPDRGLRISGYPTWAAKSLTWSAESTAAEAAVGTPASRSACFIDGLSRHSQAVRRLVPGMWQASRTSAVAMMCDSTVASIRSTHSLSWTHSTAACSWPTSVTLPIWW